MNPSVMVLVKNESFFLPFVLKQCEGLFDSYVIYDIGSTDNTRDIIDWFVARNEGKADLLVRKLPHVDPDVQGAFRNSMIPEGQRDIYWILDGDELYSPKDLALINPAADHLAQLHALNTHVRFGVFKRVEMNYDLTHRYTQRRSHHRLYHRSAFWYGRHPGEVSGYKQCERSEQWFPGITVWHFHNTMRSPKDAEALKRADRKTKRTYHPGELEPFDLLAELPVLHEPIENFPVSPILEKLWEEAG